jgi:hypothetical protein
MTEGRRNQSRQLTKGSECHEEFHSRTVGLIGLALATVAMATRNPVVGGEEMFPDKNIVQNA